MKKGFTLIELLAVIVILAIIALIATPIILNIINDTKKESLVRSAENYLRAVEQSIGDSLLIDPTRKIDGEYEILENGKKVSNGEYDYQVNYDGTGISEGTITIEDGNVIALTDCIINNKSVTMDEKGKITIGDTVEPTEKPISFSTDSWKTIIDSFKNGKYKGVYNVGDTKEIDLESLGIHTIRVSNLSTPSECNSSNFSQTACGIVLEFSDIVLKHKIDSVSKSTGGWPSTEIREYLNNDFYYLLPPELRNAIVDTFVVSGRGRLDSQNFNSIDKIYLLSAHEVWEDVDGNVTIGVDKIDAAYSSTRQLDYYKQNNVTNQNYSGAIKQYNGSNDNWWMRTSSSGESGMFVYAINFGEHKHSVSTQPWGISPAFRIG